MSLNYLFIEATFVIAGMGLVAKLLRLLDRKGGALATVMGYVVYLTLGRLGMFSLITFLITSGIATRYKYGYKQGLGTAEAKGGERGWRNVMGNGLVPTITSALYSLDPVNRELYLAAFIGAVSAIFADTMATEIGLLYRGKVRLIVGLKPASPGMPGGVSPYGFLGMGISSVVLTSVVATLQQIIEPLALAKSFLLILITGVVGSSVDSLVGQLLQASYICRSCGKIVELKSHCGAGCTRVRGLEIIDNHAVNLICCLAGALTAVTLLPVL